MSWNVLAEGLAEDGEFVRCAEEALPWGVRVQGVQGEVERYDADVVALCELNHYGGTGWGDEVGEMNGQGKR